jgi:predicted dehydrogenase
MQVRDDGRRATPSGLREAAMNDPIASPRTGRLGVGIVGCGEILPEHIHAWGSISECEIRGFFDIDRERSARAAGTVPGAAAFGTLDELLARCDLVDICSPPQAHRDTALRAIRSRRDVLIEKPVVVAVEDWEEIRRHAAEAGVKLCAVHQQKLSSHVLRAKRWLDEGCIGDLLGVHCEFMVNPVSDPMLAMSGHWVNALPGGRWFEVLPHLLYLIHMFAGRLSTGEVAVVRSAAAPSAAPAEGVMAILVGERCLAGLHLSASSHLNNKRLVLNGSKGTIEIAITRGVSTCTSLLTVRETRPVGWLGLPFVEAASTLAQWVPDRLRFASARFLEPTLHTRLVQAFVRHVRGEGPSPTPAEEIDSVVRCCATLGERIEKQLAR